MPHTLLISDLHLCPTRPHINQLFERFVQDIAPGAEALYILGDFFEYWAGDDDLADAFHVWVTSLLAALANKGVHIYIMHGNRDFLMGPPFMQAAHASFITDPALIDLYGTSTLLMHGDTLCTDDVEYQKFRLMVRAPQYQQAVLAKPLAERKAMIEALRKKSEEEKAYKSEAIMDVNADAVAQALRAHHYPRLIHGHTHRPGRHAHEVDGKLCERWVLPDWYESGGYLRCDANGCEAHSVS